MKLASLIGVELIIFLIACYFFFFKKFLEELGKQTAELTVIKQKTLEIETVKQSFNEGLETFKKQIQLDFAREIEPFKASLSKENIAYQIYNTEYVKLRFERLDTLYAAIYELMKHCQRELYNYKDKADFKKKIELYYEQHRNVIDALSRASIYISEEVSTSVFDLLNESRKAIQAFITFFDNEIRSEDSQSLNLDILKLMFERGNDSLERFTTSIDKLPALLKNVETEFKKHLTIN